MYVLCIAGDGHGPMMISLKQDNIEWYETFLYGLPSNMKWNKAILIYMYINAQIHKIIGSWHNRITYIHLYAIFFPIYALLEIIYRGIFVYEFISIHMCV